MQENITTGFRNTNGSTSTPRPMYHEGIMEPRKPTQNWLSCFDRLIVDFYDRGKSLLR
jgi:hypothetical protein